MVQKYKDENGTIVEAIQHLKTNTDEVMKFVGDRSYVQSETLFVKTRLDREIVFKNDWIVLDSKGVFHIWYDIEFKRNYTLVEPGDELLKSVAALDADSATLGYHENTQTEEKTQSANSAD